MFKARFRANKDDFKKKNLKVFHGSFFSVSASLSPTFRTGVVVSKKVFKLSPDRHKLKRRVLYAIRDEIKKHKNFPKVLMIFFTKINVNKASFQEINEDIKNLVSKVTTAILL